MWPRRLGGRSPARGGVARGRGRSVWNVVGSSHRIVRRGHAPFLGEGQSERRSGFKSPLPACPPATPPPSGIRFFRNKIAKLRMFRNPGRSQVEDPGAYDGASEREAPAGCREAGLRSWRRAGVGAAAAGCLSGVRRGGGSLETAPCPISSSCFRSGFSMLDPN